MLPTKGSDMELGMCDDEENDAGRSRHMLADRRSE